MDRRGLFAPSAADLLDIGEFVDGEVFVFLFLQHFVTDALGTEITLLVDVKIDFATTEEVLEVEQGGIHIFLHVFGLLNVVVHVHQPTVHHVVCTEIVAIDKAIALVRETGNLPVPLHLRNAPTALMKEIGYADGYKYAHDYPENFVQQQYLPDALANRRIWNAQHTPNEEKLYRKMLDNWGEKYKND